LIAEKRLSRKFETEFCFEKATGHLVVSKRRHSVAMRNRAYFLVWTFILLGQCSSFAFVSQRKSSLIFARTGRLTSFGRRRPTRTTRLTMRDASSAYWFAKGDTVQVVQDVIKANYSLKDRTGTVVETWEKCDVDPTCCWYA
jgi:hypothetical protein